MKKIVTIVVFLLIGLTFSNAQNKNTKKADTHFDRLEYVKAAEEYQKLVKKGRADEYVYMRLAESYYMVNDAKKAEPFYKRIAEKPNADAEIIYNYAQVLKINGKFEESNRMMEKFAQKNPQDSRAIDFKNNPNYVAKLLEGKARFTATPAQELNSKYSDFGGTRIGNKLYFASARNTGGKKYKRTEEPFLDIYEAAYTNGKFSNPVKIKGDVNTKFHEGIAAISPDGNTMYFDRNDYFEGKYRKDSEGENQIKLFTAELIDGQWRNIQSVPFNNSEYKVGHPALAENGNVLYFASTMPGGHGGSDLYRVTINTDGSFGTPENLGPEINTEGNEVFPFIGSDGSLYFSSDGHLGLGGLDVFFAEKTANGFGQVRNLGTPVNSSADDFAFSIDSNQEGFVSSNRGGNDDIYIIKQIEPLCDSEIDVLVVNAKTQQPLVGATVNLYDANDNKLATKTAGTNGKTSFLVECDHSYVVQASLKDYEANASSVSATGGKVNTTVYLSPIEDLIVEDQVVLNPILFDFDKHNIKPQAAFELDKLVQLMQKYPDMVIRVESHTDSRGTDAYNQDLSERRAKSTVQYVISKGISEHRISGKGFGESQLKVRCGENCTEEQHQQNRRSEFIIVSQ